MIRAILALALASALSACAGTTSLPPITPAAVATAAANAADASGVAVASFTDPVAYKAAVRKLALTVTALGKTASAFVRTRAIRPGSPVALRIADGLDAARHGVKAAAAAHNPGEARKALDEVQAAVAAVKSATAGD